LLKRKKIKRPSKPSQVFIIRHPKRENRRKLKKSAGGAPLKTNKDLKNQKRLRQKKRRGGGGPLYGFTGGEGRQWCPGTVLMALGTGTRTKKQSTSKH